MNSEEPQKMYHFYGGCNSNGYFFIKKGNSQNLSIFSFGLWCSGQLARELSITNKFGPLKNTTPEIAKNIPKTGKVSKITIGSFHTLFFMLPKENVYGVGSSRYGELSVDQKMVLSSILITSEALKGVRIGDIACGDGFSIFLSKNGVPYSCGYNKNGQCGVGDTYLNIYSAIPMKMKEKIIQIDCGGSFSVLLTKERDIYKTGSITIAESIFQTAACVPTKLKINEKVKFFRAGSYHLLVVGMSEQLYGTGSNFCNQLTSKMPKDDFYGDDRLTKITSLKGKIKDIKCSEYDSYALMENSDLYGWGRNDFGQSKGNGTVTTTSPYNPTPFKMKSNVEQIEVGRDSCIVFCKEGVYVCGKNENGELGMGNTNNNYAKLTLNKSLKNIKRIVPNSFIPKFDPKKLIFDIIIKMH